MKSHKPTVIYLQGYGHSGSTLLNLILGSSNNTFSLGEFMFLKNAYYNYDSNFKPLKNKNSRCSCGEDFKHCPFWNELKHKISIENLYQHENSSKHNIKILKHILFNSTLSVHNDFSVYSKIQEIVGEDTILIDSSKNLHYLAYLYHSNEVNLKVIFLARDGRGVINSMKRKKNQHMLTTLSHWCITNILSLKFLKNNNIAYLHISYDLFAQNPKKYIQHINSKLHTNISTSTFIDDINTSTFHNFGGNGMRFKKIESIHYDESWKKQMPKWKQFLVTLLCYIPNKLWVYNKK